MITAQAESFIETLEELKPLLPVHWADLALDKDRVPLDPQYDIYFHREANGELLFVTLRKDGALIGYFIAFIALGLHYKTCLTGTMDIFYIAPEHRGGTGALRMFRFALRELNRRGVQRVFFGSKLHKDVQRLFASLGLRPVEVYYSAMLEDLKWLQRQ
jgi:hypothetical protein